MAMLTVSGSFDDIRTSHIRYLEDLSNRGQVHVLLWSDALFESLEGRGPKFSQAEREYFVNAIRFVDQVSIVSRQDGSDAPAFHPVAKPAHIQGRKKVVVTGSYDGLRNGHVRFLEDVSRHGDVYAILENDANIKLLKGKRHPQISQEERRFAVGAVRYVKQGLIATGTGRKYAEPEIQRIEPDIYAVNHDSDNPDTRDYCLALGIEYLVLKQLRKPIVSMSRTHD